MIRWQLKRFADLQAHELYQILRLRSEIFVVEQNCPFVDEDGKDFSAFHLSGYIENELAAYARIIPAGIVYPESSIGRVCILSKHRGKGLGKLLFQQSLDETERLFGKVAIRIQAQAYLRVFYEAFGFVTDAEPYWEDGIAHFIMWRPEAAGNK